MNDVLAILARDKNIKLYRPELNQITGSVTATLLLQQMIYWGIDENGEAIEFYKFKQPCKHELYKSGDSWCEELGLTEEEFDTAIKKIGFKRGKSPQGQVPKDEASALVIYYTDSSRVTKYTVNVGLLGNWLKSVYYTISKTTTKTTQSPIVIEREQSEEEPQNEVIETPIGLPKTAQTFKAGRKVKAPFKPSGYRPRQPEQETRGTLEDSLFDTLPMNGNSCGVEIQQLADKLHVLKKDVYMKKLAYLAWVKSRPNDPSRWGLDMTAMVETFITRALASGEIEKNLSVREQLLAQGYEIVGDKHE